MRVLANENFPQKAVTASRGAGHDVLWVRTEMPGASDDEIIARAASENRLLLTFDTDFGELAYRRGLSPAAGVILFRFATPPLSVRGLRRRLRARERLRDPCANGCDRDDG